ncbi:MAG: SRPBCC domain-containing protein [Myxococcota bacterium]
MNPPIRKELELNCGIEHAFETFTRRIDTWWPPSHRFEPGSEVLLEGKVGGRFLERVGEKERVHGEVVRWEPPHRLSYTWRPGSDVGPTTVDIEFHELGSDRTRVEVHHREGESGLGKDWPERAKRFDRAWDAVLATFIQHLV